MKKIAIIRGSNLNKYEMQAFEPLAARYDLHAFSSRKTNFEINGISIAIHSMFSSDDLFKLILPGRAAALAETAMTQITGITQALAGLGGSLAGFDIVHTADPHYYYSYQAAKAKARYGFMLVSTQWENVPFMREHTRNARRVKYSVLSATDHFVAVSRRAKEVLLLEGVNEKRISILAPGIDTERFKRGTKDPNFLKALGASDNDIVISFAGRMTRAKGVEFLLWAFRKLKSDPAIQRLGRRVCLALFGSGSKEPAYRNLVTKLGLSADVRFAGFCPYDQMERMYETSDIFVLPSIPMVFPFPWQEQLGMVLLESMASGCAIVTTRSGSIPEVVGDAALLCQPADFLDLYENLRLLCLQENLRQELGRKARARVRSLFDSRVNADRLAEIYEGLEG